MLLKEIIAAGGVVFNENNEILFIFRRGFWDLPKGKLDPDETIEECAIREVEEEVGLKQIELQEFLCNTFHTYFDKWENQEVIKKSVWYKMKVKNQAVTIQTEEDIEDYAWVNQENWPQYKCKCYANIKQVIENIW